MKSKCVIIKESEYQDLQNNNENYKSLKTKYEELEKRYEALRKEYFDLNPGKIKIDFTSYIKQYSPTSYYTDSHYVQCKSKILDTIECNIYGKSVTLQGKIRTIIQT